MSDENPDIIDSLVEEDIPPETLSTEELLSTTRILIEEEMEIPVSIASVGPNREQTIFLELE